MVASMVHLSSARIGGSTGEIATTIVFALVFAFLGYRISDRYRAVQGVTPWRVPSLVWALICLMLPLFGLIVELLAQATTRPGTQPSSRSLATDPDAPAGLGHVRRPERVDVSGSSAPAGVNERAAAPTTSGLEPPPSSEQGLTPLFGWYPDVTGRHHLRYWDGRSWTDFVSDGTERSTDPL